jgi:DNA-binding transcriptional regulator LsrR (DeoR family)
MNDTRTAHNGQLETMVKVAQLYYEYGQTQHEIAKELKLSRSNVSRLLAKARRINLVEIKINYPWLYNSHLEKELKKKFSLKDVRVLESNSLDSAGMLKGIGILGAELLEKYLKDNLTLGMARGTGVYSAVQALRPQRYLRIRIAQMQGALGEKLSDGSDVAYFLSTRYDATFHFIHAPLILESIEATRALLKEPSIQETLMIAKNADLALVGIGALEPGVSNLIRTGVLSTQELQTIVDQGSIGDVAGCYIQADGGAPDVDIAKRQICLDASAIRRIPTIIGVAGGKLKAQAIRAALRGKLVNVLATDSAAAQELIKE